MFTGLVEGIGEVVAVTLSGDGLRVCFDIGQLRAGARHGDSIAINGVCVTVVEGGSTPEQDRSTPEQDRSTPEQSGVFCADVMAQTVAMTTFGSFAPGRRVNVERAMQLGARLGGHLVQGHVDGVGTVTEVRPGAEWRVVRISLPETLAPLVVDKGSITVDGVSLTVSAVGDDWCEVSLIPETLQATTLGEASVGTEVNLETDIVARHVARMLEWKAGHQ